MLLLQVVPDAPELDDIERMTTAHGAETTFFIVGLFLLAAAIAAGIGMWIWSAMKRGTSRERELEAKLMEEREDRAEERKLEWAKVEQARAEASANQARMDRMLEHMMSRNGGQSRFDDLTDQVEALTTGMAEGFRQGEERMCRIEEALSAGLELGREERARLRETMESRPCIGGQHMCPLNEDTDRKGRDHGNATDR